MLRNGVLLLGAVFFAVLGLVEVTYHRFPVVEVLLLGVLLLIPVALLVLAGFLFANGARMFRREGRSLGNMLSAVAGVGLVGLVVVTVLLARADTTAVTAVALLLFLLAGYVAAVYVVFLGYAVIYSRGRVPARVDVLVVLGSGLIRGQVPPLLRGRLDRAITAYRASEAAGTTPVMIPSGGQGADEPRAEGDAMAEYVIGQGIPAERVFPETRSRNTLENLRFSKEVAADAGVVGTELIVTSDYHVMRTAMLARSIGSDAEVIGGRTAAYYVPSAFLREFVAVIAAHKILHAVAVVGIIGLWLVLLTGLTR